MEVSGVKRERGADEIIRRAILRARVNVYVKYSEVRLRVKGQRSHFFFAPARLSNDNLMRLNGKQDPLF